ENMGALAVNCLVAVGSNLPSPTGSIAQSVTVALELLADIESVEIVAQSRFYETPAYPAGSGPDFINAAIEISTDLSPEELLKNLHNVEEQMGRVRGTRWAARLLDLDLLTYGTSVLPDVETFTHWLEMPEKRHSVEAPEQLILPHPRMQSRGFVLVPLAEIAADWRHPELGLTVRQMLDNLPPDVLIGIRPLGPQVAGPTGVRGK
ncbi:MAG: 2-amino-4-hydroxy-6-hydroxymethyldihydropteridine diphosphokinase, partial [Paracoccaceae bacterium]